MPRYIDAEKLIAHLKDEIKASEPVFDGRACGKSVAYGTELGLKAAISFAETLATADVVPKSEVDRLNAVMKEMDEQRAYTINMLGESLEKAKSDVAREIFEEIDTLVNDYKNNYIQSIQFIAELAELKKKYTKEIKQKTAIGTVTKERFNKAKQCLIDNGVDVSEVEIILQALCYILCDEETVQYFEKEV